MSNKEVLPVIKPQDTNASVVHKEPERFWWDYKWNGGKMCDPTNWRKSAVDGQILPAETEVHLLAEKTHPQLVLDK